MMRAIRSIRLNKKLENKGGDIMPAADEKNQNETHIEIPDFEINALARCLLPKIQAYFNSPEGQAEFKEWKKEQNTQI